MDISAAFKSFWHTMTSNDRHSNYNSSYRSGKHVPLDQDGRRLSGLTAVATASESRADVSSPYFDESAKLNASAATFGHVFSPTNPSSAAGLGPGATAPLPYSPGARSESLRHQSQPGQPKHGFDTQSGPGEIPMQSFQDGLAPPPPISHSWRRIDNWADENYPELYDQLCEGCTSNDLNELEHILDCSLPVDVRESLQIHDGQERGGNPTGIIFSSMLLDCEEIVQEWENWRKVNQEYLQESAQAAAAAAQAAANTAASHPAVPPKTLNGNAVTVIDLGESGGPSDAASSTASNNGEASSSSVAGATRAASAAPMGNPMWRQELLARQNCIPANAVQRAYVHPAWIPLVRDWGGNNLAVDLAPGPAGQWGQVILFGRDYDTKYVVARSWSAFVALVADDLNSGKWYIDEDSKELKLREFKSTRVEPAYFDILRWRTDQKYGRRGAKRKSVIPGGSTGSPTDTGSPRMAGSPYASPVEPSSEPRGRPLQRLSVTSPLASPNRPGYGKPTPLARVTEEATVGAPEIASPLANGKAASKLVEVETPRTSDEQRRAAAAAAATATATATAAATNAPTEARSTSSNTLTSIDVNSVANATPTRNNAKKAAATPSAATNEKFSAVDLDDETMKTIEI